LSLKALAVFEACGLPPFSLTKPRNFKVAGQAKLVSQNFSFGKASIITINCQKAGPKPPWFTTTLTSLSGTVILEKGKDRVLAVLPDRKSETVSEWFNSLDA
jgi:hypothetical protein